MAKKNGEQESLTSLGSGVVAPGEELVHLDTDEITTTFKNIRTGDFTTGDSGEDGKGQSFESLTKSIEAEGQRVPVVVRRNGKKYELISGFRRYTAIKTIEANKGEKLKVIAIVKQLNDANAILENLIENQRENLRGPDLMMGLDRLHKARLHEGSNLSNRQLAALVGCNQSYASDLLAILRDAPECAEYWHKAIDPRRPNQPTGYQLTIRDMRSVAKIDRKEDGGKAQIEMYQKLLDAKSPKDGEEGEETTPPDWTERAIKKAETIADIIGHLERRGCIKPKSLVWEEELETLGIKVPKDAKKGPRKKVGRAAEKAYQAALAWVEPAEEEEEAAE